MHNVLPPASPKKGKKIESINTLQLNTEIIMTTFLLTCSSHIETVEEAVGAKTMWGKSDCYSTQWCTLIYNSLRKRACKQLTHFRHIFRRNTGAELLFCYQTKHDLRLTGMSRDRQLVLKETSDVSVKRRGVAHTSLSVLCLDGGRETTKAELVTWLTLKRVLKDSSCDLLPSQVGSSSFLLMFNTFYCCQHSTWLGVVHILI